MKKLTFWLFLFALILVSLYVFMRKAPVSTTAGKMAEQQRIIDAQMKAQEMTTDRLGADILQSKQKELEDRRRVQEALRKKMQAGK